MTQIWTEDITMSPHFVGLVSQCSAKLVFVAQKVAQNSKEFVTWKHREKKLKLCGESWRGKVVWKSGEKLWKVVGKKSRDKSGECPSVHDLLIFTARKF